jgi:IS5 family transposase
LRAETANVVSWKTLRKCIEPFYPRAGSDRPRVNLERKLRIYVPQHVLHISDPGAEEALYDPRSMCRFVGVDLGRKRVLNKTMLLNLLLV